MIEQGIPLPVKRGPAHRPIDVTRAKRKPWGRLGRIISTMAVGESILLDTIPATESAANSFRHRYPQIKITIGKTRNGPRVWRVR